MTTLFISDLHLDPRDGDAVRVFTEFVDREARGAHALYILGDLFEAWIGDDDDDPGLVPILSALARLRDAGVRCAVMHGNRDFLLGPRFAAATGCRLLGDFETIVVQNEPLLLTHGDLLCTDDTRYQALRVQLRNPEWQRGFLAKPLGERRAIAADLRRMSASEIAAKAEDIMDVNQTAVERTMREHGVRRLLHGHTHRPAVHHFDLDGGRATRIVLGAWHDGVSVVRWNDSGFSLGDAVQVGQ